MTILQSYPPNYERIRSCLSVRRNCVFAYGNVLYNPSGLLIPSHLMVHEETHRDQQGPGVEEWWERYLQDPAFRLQQEIEAYRAQYRFVLRTEARPERRRLLAAFVRDLSTLYDLAITREQAIRMIRSATYRPEVYKPQ